MYKKVTVVIPSYKPDEKLISTVSGIIDIGFSDIIVVDDGGGERYAEYFRRVREEFGCTVLHHEVNRGKGAALKTAFKYYAENRADSLGLVTADADGQHLPKDIVSVAEKMCESQSVVLGSRDFSEPHVPPRSKAGNRITSAVFKIFFGMRIGDTQTGLRGIPRQYVSVLAEAYGDRYEYETHMLFIIKQRDIPFCEVKISTVYIDENSSSHFRVFHDSMRIYAMLLRFAASSIGATAIEAAVFFILLAILSDFDSQLARYLISAVIARVGSSLINYTVNANDVFRVGCSARSFFGYLLFAVPRAVITFALAGLLGAFAIGATGAVVLKFVFDFLLFTFSFRVQHNRIFRNKH